MKPPLLATAALAPVVVLISFSLADLVTAENCIGELGVSVCLQERSDYDRINRIYQQVLGRNADYQELRTWSREITRGRTLGEIRHQIAKSREVENAIGQIYLELLGRNAGRESLEYWTRRLAKGTTMRQLRQTVERSREARLRRQQQNL